MRQILCRGQLIDSDKWVYGYYIRFETRQPCPIDDELAEDEIIHLIAKSGFADWNMPRQLDFHKVKPETVGQYTGKKTIKEIMIYEDDYIELVSELIGQNDFNGIVKQIEGCWFVDNGTHAIPLFAEGYIINVCEVPNEKRP